MNLKISIIYVIVVPCLSFLGCSLSSRYQKNDLSQTFATEIREQTEDFTTYSCAASSLYCLCEKSGLEISFQQCVEFLPLTDKGNSMLEFKRALRFLGFQVEANELNAEELVEIQTPSVILLYLSQKNCRNNPEKPLLGHYFVLLPVDEHLIEIQNYPYDGVVISKDYFIKHLHRIGIENAPTLLCRKE